MAGLSTGLHRLGTPTAKRFFQGVVGVFMLLACLRLMLGPPMSEWGEDTCPITFYDKLPQIQIGARKAPAIVSCSAVIQNDAFEISKAENHRTCRADNKLDEKWYISFTKSCDMFRHSRGYTKYPVSSEEKDFPLAFSILTYEDVEQTERLLRAIYRPHNFYCIHADLKSGRQFRLALEGIAGCLEHVFLVEDPVRVYWAEYTVLEAELRCMEALLARSAAWRYFINLTGREFPLRTNLELVRILKAYNGANDIEGAAHG